MIVHLVDGTYELFRHFYGLRRFNKGKDRPSARSSACCNRAADAREGATHLGVATDHVIESFRNDLWPGYKTGEGIEPALLAQFHPLEEALAAMGVAVWPMIELEADDALASAARLAAEDAVERSASGPDKDLAQCVRGDRVVQVDRRGKRSATRRGAREVRRRARVDPRLSRARRRRGGRISRHRGHRRGDGRAAHQPARADREVSARRARRAARAGAPVQEARDAANRRAAVPRRGRAALARPDRARLHRGRREWTRRACSSAALKAQKALVTPSG